MMIDLTMIPQSPSQTVLFKPLNGILDQRNYLPIRFMPTTSELPLVEDPLDPRVIKALLLQIHLQHGTY